MLYYGDRMSDNISRREPEGYLICLNVPIARCGTQEYLGKEIGLPNEEMVTVTRPEDEVFSDATIASFEGMPVTNDHPDDEDGVNTGNIRWLQKGHCQNIRRGAGNEQNMLLADLVITDPETIADVMGGKREISCGYNYELCEEDGHFVQRQIRGNHIAIVDKGRAGHRVCIKDSAISKERGKTKMSKTKHGIWAKMLAAFAKDADPEEVAEAVEAIDDIVSDEPETEKPVGGDLPEKLDTIVDILQSFPNKKEEAVEEKVEEVKTDEVPDKQDVIIDLLKKLVEQTAAKDEEPAPVDPLKKLENDLDEIETVEAVKETEDEDFSPESEITDGDEEEEEETYAPDEDPAEPESHFVDPEKINEEDEDETEPEEEKKPMMKGNLDKKACDSMRAAIRAVRPVIAKLPPNARMAAADAAAASIRQSYGMTKKPVKNDYQAIQKRRKASDKVAVNNSQIEADLARRIMEKRNVNYKK